MVNLPEQPSVFRPGAASDLLWWWRLEQASGDSVEVEEYTDARFPNQADAESWIGEVWPELVESGVDAVTLFEGDREVYGPMSLHT